MGGKKQIGAVLLAAAILVALVAGCGGGSSSSSPSAERSEPSAEFLGPKGENSETAEFGEKASEAERERASEVLEENLDARASGDWEGQCSSLTGGAVRETEERASFAEGCVKSLELLAGEPPSRTKTIRENTLTGPIDALRVKGSEGYALYHGTKGKDYAMKMEKVGGQWKVASINTTELP